MKKRLDILLVEKGLCDSRTRAQALVMEGKVRVAGQVERKASRQVEDGSAVEVEEPPRFVSRGGEKMQGAFEKFPGLSAEGRVCIDVGSSTGGFTDCLLQHGAAKVLAVDVGTNQLAYKLRSDPRVWVRENYNARFMKPADLPEVPTLAVTDVSFISLKLTLLLRDFLIKRVVIPLALRTGIDESLDYPTLVGTGRAGDCCFLHYSHLALEKCYFLPFLSSEIRFFQSAEIPLPERTAEVISLITL